MHFHGKALSKKIENQTIVRIGEKVKIKSVVGNKKSQHVKSSVEPQISHFVNFKPCEE